MLKKIISLKIILFFCLSAYSQNLDKLEFIGSLMLEDQTLISYKLNISVDEKGVFSGVSITDFSGEHRTESAVKGKIDLENDLVSFSEIKNLSTQSDYDESSFCYVNVKDAKIKLRNRKSLIEGQFQGKFPNGEDCVSGEIKLIGADFFFKKMEKLEKKISRIKKIDSLTKEKLSIDTFKDRVEGAVLKNNEVIAINFNNDNYAYLEIWDEELEDGDRIDVFLNKALILEDYEIKNQKKVIKIPLDSNTIHVSVIANNVGEKAPNTVSLILRDSQQSHKMRTMLNENEQTYIVLKKDMQK